MTNQAPKKTVHVIMINKRTKEEITVSTVVPESEQEDVFKFASTFTKRVWRLGNYRAIGFSIKEDQEVK